MSEQAFPIFVFESKLRELNESLLFLSTLYVKKMKIVDAKKKGPHAALIRYIHNFNLDCNDRIQGKEKPLWNHIRYVYETYRRHRDIFLNFTSSPNVPRNCYIQYGDGVDDDPKFTVRIEIGKIISQTKEYIEASKDEAKLSGKPYVGTEETKIVSVQTMLLDLLCVSLDFYTNYDLIEKTRLGDDLNRMKVSSAAYKSSSFLRPSGNSGSNDFASMMPELTNMLPEGLRNMIPPDLMKSLSNIKINEVMETVKSTAEKIANTPAIREMTDDLKNCKDPNEIVSRIVSRSQDPEVTSMINEAFGNVSSQMASVTALLNPQRPVPASVPIEINPEDGGIDVVEASESKVDSSIVVSESNVDSNVKIENVIDRCESDVCSLD